MLSKGEPVARLVCAEPTLRLKANMEEVDDVTVEDEGPRNPRPVDATRSPPVVVQEALDREIKASDLAERGSVHRRTERTPDMKIREDEEVALPVTEMHRCLSPDLRSERERALAEQCRSCRFANSRSPTA